MQNSIHKNNFENRYEVVYSYLKILKEENNRNYCSFELQAKSIFSHHERLLSMIELAVFGNANIQKAEFEKFIKKYPQYKSGLRAYE